MKTFDIFKNSILRINKLILDDFPDVKILTGKYRIGSFRIYQNINLTLISLDNQIQLIYYIFYNIYLLDQMLYYIHYF